VALYGVRPGWAMTERGRTGLQRSATTLAIGPSRLAWDGDGLLIDVNELTFPLPSRFRGRIRVHPQALSVQDFALDPAGHHRWSPIAVRADVAVDFSRPGLSWRGAGYLDSNFGDEPLEAGFRDWQWSRAHVGDDCMVAYEGQRRDQSRFALGLRFDRAGTAQAIDLPPPVRLPPTLWAMPRMTRADAGTRPRLRRTLEDTPFYSRSAVETRLFGMGGEGVHESISLDRLRNPLVRLMLPFRNPRRA
jgi:carotenoid 1,2-hydratase